ncbi:unnamed protein product [Schistosoma bovis]|nr:unnamed protein product [Schistosoma bovis]
MICLPMHPLNCLVTLMLIFQLYMCKNITICNYLFHPSVQDLCILFCSLIFCLLLSSTFVFQAGYINLLLSQFKDAILVTLCYLILSISLHCWGAISRWNDPAKMPSSVGYQILYAFQRTYK